MRIVEAQHIIQNGLEPDGFVVMFDRVGAVTKKSDYFPAIALGEPPLPTEQVATSMADQFAAQTEGKFERVRVATSDRFKVVYTVAKTKA